MMFTAARALPRRVPLARSLASIIRPSYGHWIDGAEVPSRDGGAALEVRSPYDRSLVTTVAKTLTSVISLHDNLLQELHPSCPRGTDFAHTAHTHLPTLCSTL